MKKYECPNNTGTIYNVATLSEKLQSTDTEFIEFFAKTLLAATLGDADAKKCVDSYYIPDDKEMQDLGIAAANYPIMRKCTESSFLLAIKAKRKFFP